MFQDYHYGGDEHGDDDLNYVEHANKAEMLNVYMVYLCCVDVAIGAPYDDEGAGSVYIHQGSRNGLVKEPAQVDYHPITPLKCFSDYKLTVKTSLLQLNVHKLFTLFD